MVDKIEKIYTAIRKVYGYGDEAEEIMDAFDELIDAYESRKEK